MGRPGHKPSQLSVTGFVIMVITSPPVARAATPLLLAVGALAVAWLVLRRRRASKAADEPAEQDEPLLRVVEIEPGNRCLVANRAIDAGVVILRELPLQQTARATDDLDEANELKLRAFCETSAETQQKVLTHFYAPLKEIDAAAAAMTHHVNLRNLIQRAETFAAASWASAHRRRRERH